MRVLLLEDDRELRRTLRDALAVEGYEVLTAASLADAQALLAHAREPLDLVVLDLGLPDGDGEELLAAVRRQESLPVLVISARQAEGQKIRLLDAGADDYLVKPFGVAELLARMRVALRHRGTHLQRGASRTLQPQRRWRWTWPPSSTRLRRPARAPDAHRVQAAGAPGAPGRPGRHAPPTAAPTCGARNSPNTRTTCACTWASCAPSWKTQPAEPHTAADGNRRGLSAGGSRHLNSGGLGAQAGPLCLPDAPLAAKLQVCSTRPPLTS